MNQPDQSHLNSLLLLVSRERVRLADATTESERRARHVRVAGLEREVEAEYRFLGLTPPPASSDVSDEDLLAELGV